MDFHKLGWTQSNWTWMNLDEIAWIWGNLDGVEPTWINLDAFDGIYNANLCHQCAGVRANQFGEDCQ